MPRRAGPATAGAGGTGNKKAYAPRVWGRKGAAMAARVAQVREDLRSAGKSRTA